MNDDLLREQIRDRLMQYLRGATSLDEFRAWFAPATWQIDERNHKAETQMLVHEIEHRIAEFTSGAWTEDELLEHFTEFVPLTITRAANATNEKVLSFTSDDNAQVLTVRFEPSPA